MNSYLTDQLADMEDMLTGAHATPTPSQLPPPPSPLPPSPPPHFHFSFSLHSSPTKLLAAYSFMCIQGDNVLFVSHCNTLQHTATHGSTLQHTCNTLHHTAITEAVSCVYNVTTCHFSYTAIHGNTLQHTATHCNTRAPHCITLYSWKLHRVYTT